MTFKQQVWLVVLLMSLGLLIFGWWAASALAAGIGILLLGLGLVLTQEEGGGG